MTNKIKLNTKKRQHEHRKKKEKDRRIQRRNAERLRSLSDNSDVDEMLKGVKDA